MLRIIAGFVCLAALSFGQQSSGQASVGVPKVGAQNTYHRIIAVVPVVGTGTPSDPRRPKYAPWPPATGESRSDIIAYSHIASDDGKFAIVEFVARDRSAFQSILADNTVLVFEKGKDKPRDIETALQKYRKDFTLMKYAIPVR